MQRLQELTLETENDEQEEYDEQEEDIEQLRGI